MISNKAIKYLSVIMILGSISCKKEIKKENQTIKIIVKNNLPEKRNFETIELTKEILKLTESDSLENYSIVESKTNKKLLSQLVDLNSDGIADQLLFQPEINGNSEVAFNLILDKNKNNSTPLRVFSRFVPERFDDYAWENDRVAFRTFGPKIQQMAENNIEGGTISNGIDCWLKKVEYPIINKWYRANMIEPGAYHKDSGEGLDSYHVGSSLGCGGTAIRSEENFYSSENFISFNTITVGPIRTQFQLNYKNWDVNGRDISEKKIITLDYGNNLSKFDVSISGTNEILAGLTLHDKKGEITEDPKNYFTTYWEPHDDSYLGTAIIALPQYFNTASKNIVATPDKSHALVHLNILKNKTIYYSGFGWKEAGRYTSKEDWNEYILRFSKQLQNPLTFNIK